MKKNWLLTMALVLCGGCESLAGIPDTTVAPDATAPDAWTPDEAVPDARTPGSQYAVRVHAMGVIEPVSILLKVTGGEELVSVLQDGEITFATELEPGDSYLVEMAAESPCVLESAAGKIEDRDAEAVLVCGMLDSLAISGASAPDLGFVPATRSYRAEVSLLQESVTVTAIPASADMEITIAGESVTGSEPSSPIALGLGETAISVVVTHPPSNAQLTYEIIVDRASGIIQQAYAKASNTDAEDWFGHSVALNANGDTLAVSAPFEDSGATGIGGDQADNSIWNSGAVYVFQRSGASWIQQAYLKASNPDASDRFGCRVALNASGDTLAVGAFMEDSGATGIDGDQADNTASNSGAVYVFQRSDASWTQQAYLKASNTGAADHFGWSLALSASGDTLAVGARYEDSGATGIGGDPTDNTAISSGAVYVFQRSGATWSQQAYIKASNTDVGDEFSFRVALSASGDTLAVGTTGEDSGATGIGGDQADNTASNSGAVYVFQRSGATWAQQAYLKASNSDADDLFGTRVALSASGDTLAVSAYWEDSGATGVGGDQTDDTASDSGAVYVFQRSGATWTQQAYIKASNTDARDQFGWSVALSASGDTLAVGADGEDSGATGIGGDQTDNAASSSGAVYLFQRSGVSWTQPVYLKASNTGAGDRFGASVALSANGDTLTMGASDESSTATGINGDQADNTAGASGAVYIVR